MISVKNSYEIAYNGTENECRFELYADTTADLQGLTHIDGIKIQMGSECTDIATGDKYILNGSGVWVLQPSANAWQNVYTKAEIDSMITEIYDVIAYYNTTLISDTGEITFYSLGGNVGTLAIYGNGQQNGTPTPDNPVMPTFCGVRTGNLLENGDVVVNVGDVYKAISVSLSAGKYAFSFSYESENTGSVTIIFYNGSETVQYSTATINDGKGTVAINAGQPITTIRLYSANGYSQSVSYSAKFTNIMINTGGTALPYEPYGYKIPLTCASQTTPLYLGEVSTVRRIKKMILDGTETVTEESANVYSIPISDTVIASAGVSTHFAYDASTADGQFQIESGKAVFGYDDTLENFKAFLAAQYAAGHPVTAWYVLAAPETAIVNEPLAKIGDYADELHSEDAGITIPTVKGSNTLTVDTTPKPSRIEIQGGITHE